MGGLCWGGVLRVVRSSKRVLNGWIIFVCFVSSLFRRTCKLVSEGLYPLHVIISHFEVFQSIFFLIFIHYKDVP